MFDTTDYKFHYLMDLHYSQTIGILEKSKKCFTTLWIYTILKHLFVLGNVPVGFTTLWIYTILKHRWAPNHKITVSLPYGFTLFSNEVLQGILQGEFHYLMDLHYSQTVNGVSLKDLCFTTLWIYTILKPVPVLGLQRQRFTTLWIYTILK